MPFRPPSIPDCSTPPHQPWLRAALLCCAFSLLLFLLPAEDHRHAPHSPTGAVGLCSGDCSTCGCPPAMVASGDCCCVLSRRLVAASESAPAIVNQVEVRHDLPSVCRLPCGRTPAATTADTSSVSLLPVVLTLVPTCSAGPPQVWLALTTLAPRTRSLSPATPPPERPS